MTNETAGTLKSMTEVFKAAGAENSSELGQKLTEMKPTEFTDLHRRTAPELRSNLRDAFATV